MEEKKPYDNKFLTHSLRIDLSRMIDVDIIKIDGKEGVFIPFVPNDIYKTKKKGLVAMFRVYEQRPNPFGYTHYLRQSIRGMPESGWVGSMIPKRFVFKSEKQREEDREKFNF